MILPRRESWVFVVCLVFRGGAETLPVAISESASLQALETWYFHQWYLLIKYKDLQKNFKTQVCQHPLPCKFSTS